MSTSVFKEFLKRIAYRHTSLGRPKYPYGIEPIQLATIITELERLRSTRGNIVEIGVARGMTSRLICEHLVSQGMDKDQTFFALDTFSSFTDEDLQYEIERRGKTRKELLGFSYNDFEIWKRNFAKFPFLKAIQTDCAKFDYSTIAPIKLAFLDVDLYRPTQAVLPMLFENMAEGGVILVDDVRDKCQWDGAFQAYMEFCSARQIAPRLVGNKCGLIYKDTV